MKFYIFSILFLIFTMDVSAGTLVASDVDMSSAIVDISTIVGAVVAFLTFMMGSKTVLRMLGW